MYNRKIRFVWNVGGGTGVITHPEVIESGDPQKEKYWYRIEAERYAENESMISICLLLKSSTYHQTIFCRIRNVGKLSVRKQHSTSGSYLPEMNSTNSEYGRLDVSPTDRIWIGGIPESERRPAELLATNGLPGCVHQVTLDGRPIGLWNFITTAPDSACQACVEG